MIVEVGDKVIDEYLGDGEIVRDLDSSIRGAFLVKFDETPPFRYNMSQNPTLAFGSNLTLQKL